MSDLRIALRSLRTRLASTIVTVSLVAVAVALLLSLLSLREAGKDSFQRGVGNAHLVVSADASPLVAVLNGLFYVNAPRNSLPYEKIEEIRNGFPWAWAIPTQLGDSFRGYPVLATEEEFVEFFQPVPGEPWKLASGRPPSSALEVALGSKVSESTGLGVGDFIHLTHGAPGSTEPVVRVSSGPQLPSSESNDSEPGPAAPVIEVHAEIAPHVHDEFAFEIVGVFEPTQTHHDRIVLADLRGSWLVHAIDRREAEGLPMPQGPEDVRESDRLVTGLLLRTPTREGRNASAIVQQVFDTLRRDPSITVASPSTQIDRLFAIVSGIDSIFIAMAAVVLVSSAVGVLLALWNSMETRRRQVAILRVLGASRSRVLGLVLSESAIMGLLGCFFGILLAILGGVLAASALQSQTGVVIEPELNLRSTILVAAATVVLAALAGLAPAVRAYRTPVAEHLRPLG